VFRINATVSCAPFLVDDAAKVKEMGEMGDDRHLFSKDREWLPVPVSAVTGLHLWSSLFNHEILKYDFEISWLFIIAGPAKTSRRIGNPIEGY